MPLKTARVLATISQLIGRAAACNGEKAAQVLSRAGFNNDRSREYQCFAALFFLC
jgi:hypothetical protein